MPKVSIYLPDSLYRQAQEKGLPLSTLTQQAVERALKESNRTDWIAQVRSRKARFHEIVETGDLLHQVRDEFGE